MVDFASITNEQIKELYWFVTVMKVSKSVILDLIESNKINRLDKRSLNNILDTCDWHMREEIDVINHIGFVGLNCSEKEIKSKLSKLYLDWEIIRVENGPALYSVINDFSERYKKVYDHIQRSSKGELYELYEEYYSVEHYLYDKGINIYQEQDVFGNNLEELSCNENFYRVKIKDSVVKSWYELSTGDEEDMKVFKYCIQKLIYALSPHGLIIGMNIYDGMDYIDVLLSSRYYNSYEIGTTMFEDYSNIDYAIEIVQAYALKVLISKMIEE